MEEYGNNGIFGVDRKHMRAMDKKQEIYLEWPYICSARYINAYIVPCSYIRVQDACPILVAMGRVTISYACIWVCIPYMYVQ